MKKFILPAFAFVLALSSCKKDDTSPSAKKQLQVLPEVIK